MIRHKIELPEEGLYLQRDKLFFCGKGPSLCPNETNNNGASDTNQTQSTSNNNRQNTQPPTVFQQRQIWPRDSLQQLPLEEDECRKILAPDILSLIKGQQRNYYINRIKDVVRLTFGGLKKCNMNCLFNKYCPLEPPFDRITFEVHFAMDSWTTYKNIFQFIQEAIRSINRNRSLEHRGQDISKILFGTDRNYDIFKRHVRMIISSPTTMARITLGQMLNTGDPAMDLDKIPWLDGLNSIPKKRIYFQFLFALFKFINKLLQRYFYVTIANPYGTKPLYFRYDLWQKIQAKALASLVKTSVLAPFEQEQENTDPTMGETASKIRFHLKKDNLRLICIQSRTKSKNHRLLPNAVFRYVLRNMPNHENFKLTRLLEAIRYFKREKFEKNKEIYFVSGDIQNCFQSIKQDLLLRIMIDRLGSHFGSKGLVRLVKCECIPDIDCSRRRMRKIKPVYRWFVGEELNNVIGKYKSVRHGEVVALNLEIIINEYLKPCIMGPVLKHKRSSRRGFRLTQGIRQGSSSSPILCSIYTQDAFNKVLDDYLEAEDCRLFRYVDDILFITSNLDRAKQFVDKMVRGFEEHNLRLNVEKLAYNFPCRGIDERLRPHTDHLVFHKQRISFETLQCSYDYPRTSNQLQYTFRVNPYLNHDEIIYTVLRTTIPAIHLDCELNGLDQVMVNIFERALLFAHRAASAILISFHLTNHEKQDTLFIKKLVILVTRKMCKTIESLSAQKLIFNTFNYFQIRLIVAAAFQATWSRDQLRCRAKERKFLELYRSRLNMKYTVHKPPSASEVEWERRIQQLVTYFPKSSFRQNVNLPRKGLVE